MKNPVDPAVGANRARSAPRAFTLVEVLMAMAVGMLVMAAVASILVMSLRLVNKNQQIDAAVSNTRMVQEHFNSELAKAISQSTPVDIRPRFSNTSGGRSATMTYRVPVGSYSTVTADAAVSSSTLQITCPSDVVPEVGDYVLMDAPNLLDGIRISSMTGSNPYTLTLASIMSAHQDGTDTTTTAFTGKLVRIQREREYEVVAPAAAGATTTELRWYESTIDVGAIPAKYTVLSTHVDAASPYLFAQVPADVGGVAATESSVSWHFGYVATGTGALGQNGSTETVAQKNFYQTNYAEGMIIPKSGNPLSANSIAGGGPTTLGTSTTLVSSTTTLGTSTSQSSTSTSKSSTSTSQTSSSVSSTSSSKSSTSSSKTSSSVSSTSSSKSSTSSSQSTSSSKSSTSSSQSSTSTSKSSTSSSNSTSSSQSTTSSKSSTSSSVSSTSTSKSSSTSSSKTSTSQSSTSTSKSSTSTSQTSTSVSSTSTSKSSTTTTTLGTSTSKSSTSTSKSSTTTTIPFDG